MKLRSMYAIAVLLIAGCGSEVGADANGDTPPSDTPATPGNGGGNGTGVGGGTGTLPPNDSGVGPVDQDSGTGDTDSGSTTDTDAGTDTGDSGSGGDQDGGTVDTDSGTGGGDQDSGSSGGGDQDSGSTGGDQDGGTTTGGDSGTGGGGDQDSGTGGGQDSGGDDHCTPHSCTYTQGYYKNHTSTVTGLTLGGVSYSQSDVLGFLNATPNGDDSLILAKQLIAALLNGGACDPNSSATVQAAQDWMTANKDQDGTLPYGTTCVSQSDPGCTAYSLGQTLDAYNSGSSGTPHCQ